MDGREQMRRSLLLQVILGVMVFLGISLYLIYRDTPGISLLDFIKGIVKLALFFIPGMLARIPNGVWTIFFDIGLFFVAYLVWVSFFVQFGLPVRNFVQRVLAAVYVSLYSLGIHGPAVKIDNGSLPAHYPKKEPRGLGVLVLDTASSAVLRRRSNFTRSVGPGLVFTRPREYVAGVVDLHRKAWPAPPGFGPKGQDEDPFIPRDEKIETLEAYDERQRRRFETSAETRDGVEVVPNIFVLSRIDPDHKPPASDTQYPWVGLDGWLAQYLQSDFDTQSRFGYNPEAVRLAITGEEIDPKIPTLDTERRRFPWYQLPVLLAIDLWREYVRKFKFEELFTPLEAYGKKTALQVIQEKVTERLTREFVDGIDSQGQPTGSQEPSHEYNVMQDRGIKVLFAPIRNLHFQKQVDQQLEDQWFAYWHWRATDEREYIERLRSYKEHEGEMEALRDFAYSASRRFEPAFLTLPRPRDANDRRMQMRDALELILRGTLRECVNDTELHQRLVGEETQLVTIIDWLRRQKA